MSLELAVYLTRSDDLARLDQVLAPLDPQSIPGFLKASVFGNINAVEFYRHLEVIQWLEDFGRREGGPIRRLYFGQEFCEHLIPDPETVARAYYQARQMEWAFTFTTGCVTDAGLGRLLGIFRRLAAEAGPIEVVANDWGVLRRLRQDFPQLVPVLGRLMIRQQRLARFYTVPPPVRLDGIEAPEAVVRQGQLEAIQGTNLDHPAFRQLVADLGVKRLDVDIVPQGLRVPADRWGFGLSCYFPWSYVAGGRNCWTAALADPLRALVAVDSPCPQLCRDRNRAADIRDYPDEIVQRGNSVFVRNVKSAMPYWDQQIPIDRCVVEPYIPL